MKGDDPRILIIEIVECLGQPVMNAVRCVKADPGMMMLGVVPIEERSAEHARILNRAESIRKLWSVFHRSELGFRERVVIGNVRTRVGLGYAQIGEQLGNQIGLHR